jgi:hypothetical protein
MRLSRKDFRPRRPKAVIREARHLIALGAGTRAAYNIVVAHGRLDKRDRLNVHDRLYSEQGE